MHSCFITLGYRYKPYWIPMLTELNNYEVFSSFCVLHDVASKTALPYLSNLLPLSVHPILFFAFLC